MQQRASHLNNQTSPHKAPLEIVRVRAAAAGSSTDNLSACSRVSEEDEDGESVDEKMAYKTTYHEDSDADDEFERSVFVSATVEPDLSPTDSDMTSPEHTPTTFTHSLSGTSHVSPTSLVTHWTPKQCADWVSAFAGLGLYADAFIGMQRGEQNMSRRLGQC